MNDNIFKNLTVENNLLVNKRIALDDNLNINFGRGIDLFLDPKYKLNFTKDEERNEEYMLLKKIEPNTDFNLIFEKENIVNSSVSGILPRKKYLWQTKIDNSGNYVISHNIESGNYRIWKDVITLKRQLGTITNKNFTMLMLENLNVKNTLTVENTLNVGGDISSNTIKFNETNIGIGKSVLKNNIDGENNTAMGEYSCMENINGSDNTCFGFNTLTKNTNGLRNVAFGSESLLNNRTGSNNIAIGYHSQYYNKRGDFNTNIGAQSNQSGDIFNVVGTTTLGGNTFTYRNFATAIGYGAIATKANQIMLGRETEDVYIPGHLMIKDSSNNYTDFLGKIISLDISNSQFDLDISNINHDISNIKFDISNIDVSKNNLDLSLNELNNKYNTLSDNYTALDISYTNLNTAYENLNTLYQNVMNEIADLKTKINEKAESNHDHEYLDRVNNTYIDLDLKPMVPDELDLDDDQ